MFLQEEIHTRKNDWFLVPGIARFNVRCIHI